MKRFLFVILGVVAVCGGASASTTLLDDGFSESSRSNPANLPTSTPWYYSAGTATNLGISSGKMTWNTGATSSSVLGYFTPQTLGTNDSIQLSFTFTATGIANVADGFRVALFSSGGSKVSGENYSPVNSLFDGYTGYGAMVNLGSGSNVGDMLLRRNAGLGTATPSADNLLGNNYPTFMGPAGTDLNLASGTTYTGTLTITNNGANDTITYSLGGTTLTFTDSASHYTSFDTIAFQTSSTQASSIAFSDIKVTYTAAPEPSSAALFGGAALFLAFVLGRVRRLA